MQEMQAMQIWSLGGEDPLEEKMATYSSIVPRKIPWPEEPGRLQSMGSQRVRHDWATKHTNHLEVFFKTHCCHGSESENCSVSHVQLFATLWTVQSMEFSRSEYWSGLPFPSPGESSQPRDRTQVSCIASGFFTSWVTREARTETQDSHAGRPTVNKPVCYAHLIDL